MRMLPTLPGLALAPTTATDRGRKSGSRECAGGGIGTPEIGRVRFVSSGRGVGPMNRVNANERVNETVAPGRHPEPEPAPADAGAPISVESMNPALDNAPIRTPLWEAAHARPRPVPQPGLRPV